MHGSQGASQTTRWGVGAGIKPGLDRKVSGVEIWLVTGCRPLGEAAIEPHGFISAAQSARHPFSRETVVRAIGPAQRADVGCKRRDRRSYSFVQSPVADGSLGENGGGIIRASWQAEAQRQQRCNVYCEHR